MMEMFVIYERPRDYPDKFVVRVWVIGAVKGEPVPTQYFMLADTLEAARKFIPYGLVCINRSESDELQIIESWI